VDIALISEIDHALVLRLAAEVQGFARELHDEAALALATTLASGDSRRQQVLLSALVAARRLDRGNATPQALAEDFKTLGIEVWSDLALAHPVEVILWRQALQALNETRNAIAHDDPTRLARIAYAGWSIDLEMFTRWRGILDALAHALDALVGNKIQEIFGGSPW
jgi:hypothetical protein